MDNILRVTIMMVRGAITLSLGKAIPIIIYEAHMWYYQVKISNTRLNSLLACLIKRVGVSRSYLRRFPTYVHHGLLLHTITRLTCDRK